MDHCCHAHESVSDSDNTADLGGKVPGTCLAVTIALDLAFTQRVHGKALLHALPVCAKVTVTGGLFDAVGARDVLSEAP